MKEVIKQLVISIIVLFVAIVLTIIFVPFGFAYGVCYRIIYKRDFLYIAKILKRMAVSLDQLDNVICGDFLDHTMIIEPGNNFGLEDDTVSEVLEKNNNKNLTKLGKSIAYILEKIDPGHLARSLEENVL